MTQRRQEVATKLVEAAARQEVALNLSAETNAKGDTFLHVAADYNCAAVAEALVKAGCDCNARGARGATPCHYAVIRGHANVAAVLVKGGAQIDLPDEQVIQSALIPLQQQWIASMAGNWHHF